MDKRELRTVISTLFQPGQRVQATLRSLAGDFDVVNKRCGRGKGGSWLAELRHVNTGESVTIGTPDSDDVLNVTVDGTFYGLQSFEELPPSYTPNPARAVTLKEQTRELVQSIGTQVRIVAPEAREIDGTFRVVGGNMLRGRGGQVVLRLEAADGSLTTLWSYRHSGVVESLDVVND